MEPNDITSDYSFIIHQLDDKIASSHQQSNSSSSKKYLSDTDAYQNIKKLRFSENNDILNASSFINDTNDISINSTSIKFQSQIDECKIQMEKYKEELRNSQAELQSNKDQTTRQLIFLEEANAKIKKESEQRLEKYYEEKKIWQGKIRELEHQNQLLKKNNDKFQSSRSSSVLMTPTNNNNNNNNNIEIIEKLSQFQKELEQERNEKLKLKNEKLESEKNILELHNKIKLLESTIRTSGDDELDIKLLRKNNNELNLIINKQKKDIEKLTNKITNQEKLEEDISSLNNKLMLNQDIVKDYNNIQIEFSKLNEEKNKWKSFFHSIIDSNQELLTDEFSPATVINLMNDLQEKYLQAKANETSLSLKLESSLKDLDCLTQENKNKEESLKNLNNTIQNLYIKLDIVKKQSDLYVKENSSIKFLLDSYEKEFSHKSPEVDQIISGKNKVIEDLSKNYNELAEIIKELEKNINDKINQNDPVLASYNSLEEKYKNLKENFFELQEITGVDLLPSNTKVLRYSMNPSDKLYKSKDLNSSSYPGDVIDKLSKKILNFNENKEFQIEPVSTLINEKKESNIVDPQKRILRLKDVFLDKISKFRQAVCILTGYKMDMLPADPTDPKNKTRIRLRSIYASSPEDDLLFLINEESPELLETQFTKTIDPTSMVYLTNFNSVPVFLSTITQQLFENQTFLG